MQRTLFFVSRAVAVSIVIGCAWASYDTLSETHGSGPPYYGRTTNMDKWVDPVPVIVAINLVGVLVAATLLKVVRRP